MSDEKRALADLHYLLVGTELSEYIFTLFLFFFYDSNVCSSHNSQDISSAFTTKSSFHYTVNGHIFGSHPIRQTFSRVLLSSVY